VEKSGLNRNPAWDRRSASHFNRQTKASRRRITPRSNNWNSCPVDSLPGEGFCGQVDLTVTQCYEFLPSCCTWVVSGPSHSGCCAVLSKWDDVLKSSYLPSAAAIAVFCKIAAISCCVSG